MTINFKHKHKNNDQNFGPALITSNVALSSYFLKLVWNFSANSSNYLSNSSGVLGLNIKITSMYFLD